ncbi:MAG: hypothetical protein LBR00_07155, partial [Clostridiales Family XIII bacterium]|nr:hypothetical protein [Clostridiales Family XIII bacterium]
MKDQMTPVERFRALAEGKAVDRIPHGFGVGDTAAKLQGYSMTEYNLDAKVQVDVGVRAYREFGLDGLMAFIRTQELFGTETVYPANSTPYVAETVALEGDALKKDYLGDPKTNPKLRVFWDVLDGLFAAVGDEVPIAVAMEGTYTAAGRAIGVEKLLKLSLRDPEYVTRVLDLISDAQVRIIEALEGYGVGFGMM